MSIIEDVSAQMKAAVKAREAEKLKALRGMRAGFITAMKEDGSDTLSDEACLAVLRRLSKQRKDSIESYTSANRPDLAAEEQAELDVIETFLPALADEAQTRAWVQQAIDATGASSPREMGRVMGAVMKEHKGQVDGNLTRKIASELLS
jgi:uncharacterized protein YqeY